MDSLIKETLRFSEGAEVLRIQNRSFSLNLENARWESSADSQDLVHLRALRGGSLASATTTVLSPATRDRLLGSARLLLAHERPGPRRFASRTTASEKKSSALCEWNTEKVLHEMRRIESLVRSRTKDDLSLGVSLSTTAREFQNSEGQSFQEQGGYWSFWAYLIDANISMAGIHGIGTSPELVDEAHLDRFLDMYAALANPCKVSTGRLPVLFAPDAVMPLMTRLSHGANALNHVLGTSVLKGRMGERLLSPSLSIHDDPAYPGFVWNRAFDDEGTPTRRLPLFEEGRFVQPYADLRNAEALGVAPTGHGYRPQWGLGEVAPAAGHLMVPPGSDSWETLLAKAEGGILAWNTLGAFTGNIPQGEYSFSLSPGFYIKNGRIAGVVKDVLVSGNVYETLSNVAGIGCESEHAWGGCFPAILCNDVSVVQG